MADRMPPLAAASSSRCAPFACRRRGSNSEQRSISTRAPAAGQAGCGRPLGRAAGVVGGGIAAAFFASLERCACVEVRTADDLSDCGSAEAAPLLMGDDGGASAARSSISTARKGKRTSARAGKGRRGGHGGFGCCESTH